MKCCILKFRSSIEFCCGRITMCLRRIMLCFFGCGSLPSDMCSDGRITIVLRFFWLGTIRSGLLMPSMFTSNSFVYLDSSRSSDIVGNFCVDGCNPAPIYVPQVRPRLLVPFSLCSLLFLANHLGPVYGCRFALLLMHTFSQRIIPATASLIKAMNFCTHKFFGQRRREG